MIADAKIRESILEKHIFNLSCRVNYMRCLVQAKLFSYFCFMSCFFFRCVSIYKNTTKQLIEFSYLIFTIQQPRSEAKTQHRSHLITLIQIYFTKSPLCSSKLNVVNVDIHAVVLSVPRKRNSPIHTLQKMFPCCGVNQKVKRENPSCSFLYATKILGRFFFNEISC